jgi:hypothetical protein
MYRGDVAPKDINTTVAQLKARARLDLSIGENAFKRRV